MAPITVVFLVCAAVFALLSVLAIRRGSGSVHLAHLLIGWMTLAGFFLCVNGLGAVAAVYERGATMVREVDPTIALPARHPVTGWLVDVTGMQRAAGRTVEAPAAPAAPGVE